MAVEPHATSLHTWKFLIRFFSFKRYKDGISELKIKEADKEKVYFL